MPMAAAGIAGAMISGTAMTVTTAIVSSAVSFVVGKVVAKVSGSEALGMVAGMVAGGWAGGQVGGASQNTDSMMYNSDAVTMDSGYDLGTDFSLQTADLSGLNTPSIDAMTNLDMPTSDISFAKTSASAAPTTFSQHFNSQALNTTPPPDTGILSSLVNPVKQAAGNVWDSGKEMLFGQNSSDPLSNTNQNTLSGGGGKLQLQTVNNSFNQMLNNNGLLGNLGKGLNMDTLVKGGALAYEAKQAAEDAEKQRQWAKQVEEDKFRRIQMGINNNEVYG